MTLKFVSVEYNAFALKNGLHIWYVVCVKQTSRHPPIIFRLHISTTLQDRQLVQIDYQ